METNTGIMVACKIACTEGRILKTQWARHILKRIKVVELFDVFINWIE
jgi:hypothetical protein